MFDFGGLNNALEDFRVQEMSSFQKINDFLIQIDNDELYYYYTSKKKEQDGFPTTAPREFMLRQILVEVENSILSGVAKQGHIQTLDKEM